MYVIPRKDDSSSLVIHTATKALSRANLVVHTHYLKKVSSPTGSKEKVGILNKKQTNCF